MNFNIVYPLAISFAMSAVTFLITLKLIPATKSLFLKAGLYGQDMSKIEKNKM